MDYEKRNEEIKRLRDTKRYTLQQIGDIYNISRERVRQIVGNTGFFVHKYDHTLNDEEWLRQHRDFTNKEIAKMLGTTEDAVRCHRPLRPYPKRKENSTKHMEYIACKKLEEMGFLVSPPDSRDYDLLVNNSIKIDVKTSNGCSPNSYTERLINTYYKFNIGKQEKIKKCDFFLCHIPDHDAWFIIPSKIMVGKNYNIGFVYPHSGIGKISKFRKYKDRWDLLR